MLTSVNETQRNVYIYLPSLLATGHNCPSTVFFFTEQISSLLCQKKKEKRKLRAYGKVRKFGDLIVFYKRGFLYTEGSE